MSEQLRIIPAVLAADAKTFKRRLQIARALSPIVHVDVMDGRFVASTSVNRSALARLPSGNCYDVHLMVQRPADWLPYLRTDRVKTVVLHAESYGASLALRRARARGFKVAIALNPKTPLTKLDRLPRTFQAIQCLAVQPGRYGSAFHEGVFRKLRAARRRWPALTLSVDGGVTLGRIKPLLATGVNQLVIGSSIMLQPRPRAAYQQFLRLVNREGRTRMWYTRSRK